MTDDELLQAYLHTRWIFEDPAGVVVIGDVVVSAMLLDHLAGAEGAIITAWNPRSVQLERSENDRRQAALVAEIERAGHSWLECGGVGEKDGEFIWAEPSLLVGGIGFDEAVALGEKYGQNAIVWLTNGKPAVLVVCSDKFAGLNRGALHGDAEHSRTVDTSTAASFREVS